MKSPNVFEVFLVF